MKHTPAIQSALYSPVAKNMNNAQSSARISEEMNRRIITAAWVEPMCAG